MAKGKPKRALKVIFTVLKVILLPLKLLWYIVRPFLKPFRRPFAPVLKYLRGVRQEFKRVSWPTRREASRLTLAVIVFSIVFSAFVAVADYGLNLLFEKVIIKG